MAIVYSYSQLPETFKQSLKWRKKKVNFNDDKSNYELLKEIVSKDELRPAMNGVFYDKEDWIVATDGHKLLAIKHEHEKKYTVYYKNGQKIKGRSYPNWESVIPDIYKYKYTYTLTIDKLAKYLEVASFFVGKTDNKVHFKFDPKRKQVYTLNATLLKQILKVFKSMGMEQIEIHLSGLLNFNAYKSLRNTGVIFTVVGKKPSNDTFALLMPVVDDRNLLGVINDDFGYRLTSYYDFSKDAIIDPDGKEAKAVIDKKRTEYRQGEFSLKDLSEIEKMIEKRPPLPILQYVAIKNETLFYTDLEKDQQRPAKGIEDGVYLPTRFGLLLDDSLELSDYPRLTNKSENIASEKAKDNEVWEMTQKEWLKETRFYYSSGSKQVEYPNGKRAI
ncbi:MAG: hypothetical protein AAF806_12425, partial [Bacteroidota bacterium]